MVEHADSKPWWDQLEDEDRAFIKRFLLTSGSLNELAQAYVVSYPTVRLRLDRLLPKIRSREHARVQDPYERLLRAEFGDGKIDAATFKRLLAAYEQQQGIRPP